LFTKITSCNFQIHHFRRIFYKKLHKTLKIFKTSTTNGKGAKKAMLQSDQVLTQLKTIDGHAT